MLSPISSDISQHDIDMLKKQCHKMQRRHEEEQWLQVCLEEVTEACYVECVAQKARKAAEAKARKEAKKQRIAEEEEKKK